MHTSARKQNQPQPKPSPKTARPSATASKASHQEHPHLQRPIGNPLVQRLLGANAEELETGSGTRPTTFFAHDFSRIPVYDQSPAKVQTKLRANTPGDIYEQEADRVAGQVMRMPDSQLQRTCACYGECPRYPAQQPVKEHAPLQIRGVQSNDTGESPAPPIVHDVLRSPGQPLDSETRMYFQPRFGRDFSQARVHTDAKAAKSARAVNALAYTVGQDVVFGAGRYTPCTTRGRRLLAHELTHTIQQGAHKGDRLSRVPDAGGIREGRYNFSTNCGWIDWSHAGTGIGAGLISRVRQASDALQAAGTGATSSTGELTSSTMASRVPVLGFVLSSASLRVRLVRPLSADEVLSVALSIFKRLSIVFETQQRWTQLIGRSSFSQEDLPSNLIGFYRAARGYTRAQINQYCGTSNESASLQEYNRDHDFETNRSFLPVGITGHWPPELSNINDSQAPSLYEILTISATQGSTSFRFCPLYRVEGRIGDTDLRVMSVGGARFTAADNLRVVPTYRAHEGTSGLYGHVKFIEVNPNGQADFHTFRQHNISWPIYVPEPVLVCLSSHGHSV